MLKGKTALITGASRGIGKAIAMKLGVEGANIVINYVSDKPVEEVLKDYKAAGIDAIAVRADVSKFDEAQELIKTVVEKFGTIDILVNNAGITRDNLMLKMKEEDFDSVINTNLKGVFNCTKHASSIMLKKKMGKIINISSVIGLTGNIGQVNYAAAKAGIIGVTKASARELGSRGITVNAVAPGFIESDMTEVLPQKVKEETLNRIPLKRFGKPEEVADLVLFLASDKANYITGQVMTVDGGMIM